MKQSGWTGAQYSAFRFLLGCAIVIRLLAWMIWPDLPAQGQPLWLVTWVPSFLDAGGMERFFPLLSLLCLPLALALAAGWKDRWAALLLAYFFVSVHVYSPQAAGGGAGIVALLLLLHAFVPRGPWGSLEFEKRPVLGARWRFPPLLYPVGWLLFVAGWLHGVIAYLILGDVAAESLGVTAWWGLSVALLGLGLELAALGAAWDRRLRPYSWVVLVGMRLFWWAVLGSSLVNEGLLLLLLFLFNPDWVPPRRGRKALVFVDGDCGLCRRFTLFIFSEDRGAAFGVAPIGGRTMEESVPASRRERLPDSVCVRRPDGAVLTRSQAVRYVGERLGGIWRLKALAAGAFPRWMLDRLYDGVARRRGKLFAPASACPALPKSWRRRWLP